MKDTVIAILALVASACGSASAPPEPGGNPDGGAPGQTSWEVEVSGRVLDSSGRPVPSARVVLRAPAVAADPGSEIAGVLACLVSLGTDCPKSDLLSSAPTDARGTFLVGTDAKTAQQGGAFRLEVSSPEGVLLAELPLSGTRTSAGDLTLWAPAITVSAGRIRVAPPASASAGSLSVVVSGHAILAVALDPDWTVDAGGLEDAQATVWAVAFFPPGSGGATRFLGSPATLVRGPGAPLSRGARCRVGSQGAKDLTPCPFTDGDLATPWTAACVFGPGCDTSAITLDLGASRSISSIYVHGDGIAGQTGIVRVALSQDGAYWLEPGTITVGGGPLVFPAGWIERYVRIDSVNGVSEVSVW
jgi:hypothetical protein